MEYSNRSSAFFASEIEAVPKHKYHLEMMMQTIVNNEYHLTAGAGTVTKA
jgi:hypothetical protein